MVFSVFRFVLKSFVVRRLSFVLKSFVVRKSIVNLKKIDYRIGLFFSVGQFLSCEQQMRFEIGEQCHESRFDRSVVRNRIRLLFGHRLSSDRRRSGSGGESISPQGRLRSPRGRRRTSRMVRLVPLR